MTHKSKSTNSRKPKLDRKYNSFIVEKLVCYLMHDGKKVKAQKIVYKSFEIIKEATKKEPLEVFEKAVENASPELELKSRRLGGNNYQIPFVVTSRKKIIYAVRWIVKYARQHKAHTMEENLAREIMDSYNATGATIKHKDDIYKSAKANWAFAHYRW